LACGYAFLLKRAKTIPQCLKCGGKVVGPDELNRLLEEDQKREVGVEQQKKVEAPPQNKEEGTLHKASQKLLIPESKALALTTEPEAEEPEAEEPFDPRGEEYLMGLDAEGISGVYFTLVDTDIVKIGASKDIGARVRQLKGPGHRIRPQLLAYIPSSASHLRQLEWDLQDQFWKDWLDIPGTRELFRLSDDLLTAINKIRAETMGLLPWKKEDFKGRGVRHHLPRYHVRGHARPDDWEHIIARLPIEYQLCCTRLLALRVTTRFVFVERRNELFDWLNHPRRSDRPWTVRCMFEMAVQLGMSKQIFSCYKARNSVLYELGELVYLQELRFRILDHARSTGVPG
jgi:hypothetical protein